MKRVVVASKNPVKINATYSGFSLAFPKGKFELLGISAPSNVSDQPMSEEETYDGAMNRVVNLSKVEQKSDYWVGIEGGLKENHTGLESFAWVVVKSKSGKIGRGRTGSFFLPDEVSKLIRGGMELGDADDIVFKQKNSKQVNGAVGLLTKNIVTRTTYYEKAVVMALIPFINPKYYDE